MKLAHCLPLLFALPLAAQAGWAVPTLEGTLNSTSTDTSPNLSFDGLTMHFSSYRSGNYEIYSATRPAVGQPWSAPVLETALGGSSVEDHPWLVADGLELWFTSTRTGTAGSSDLMVATRPSVSAPWNAPTFVTELNSTGAETAPTLTADGLQVFFLSTAWGNPSGNNNSIFTASRPNRQMPFGTPTLVAQFSNTNTHRDVDVSADGLTIAYTEFVSPRLKVMFSERVSPTAPWSVPVALTEFDTVGTNLGVYSISRSALGDEALLAAGFSSSAGGQEVMSTKFTGVAHLSQAGLGQTMSIGVFDPARPGLPYSIGAALGNTGFVLGSRLVPLDPDWLLMGTFGVSVPGFTLGWGGVLDGNGAAYANLTNLDPILTGFSIYVGAFVWDASAQWGAGTITNSFRVVFQP